MGLLASGFHLGHPERAWRALSQWRSSWLSREGCFAAFTFIPAGLFAIGWYFLERTDGFFTLMAVIAATGSIATLYSTGMIYASLKTVDKWRHPLVVPLYLAFALATGGLWCTTVLRAQLLAGGDTLLWTCVLFLVTAWGLKLLYWRLTDRRKGGSSIESATGLGEFGDVRLLESPHTEENYLLKEMGFRVARKHAHKLRRIAVLAGGAIPLAFLLGASQSLSGGMAGVFLVLSLPFAMFGVFIERWLFFAEARHKVMLYYGDKSA